ncbi:CHAT domain-containing protein [Massilia sp. W12]|uniref:CHAT domain-containing protein n=1 Tax=Massilia sp. W12 TaxID=3126507 RepID=UPI0030D1C8F8
MSQITFRFAGEFDISPSFDALQAGCGIEVQASSSHRLSQHRSASNTQEIALRPDDAVCVRLQDGVEWWMRAEEAAQLMHTGQPQEMQAKQESLVCELDVTRAAPRKSRGEVQIKALDSLRFDLKESSARNLAGWVELRNLSLRKAGLFQLDLGANDPVLQETIAPAVQDGGPILLFIHGTASSTAGSFAGLWQGDVAAPAAHVLHARYGARCLAWEYLSITRGPIENTLALAKALPDGAELHVVSHSQGGLLGELLCLAQAQALPPDAASLFARDRNIATNWGWQPLDSVANGYQQQWRDLQELFQVLQQKRLRITRFVRVACPALGTTLASGRLDRWLSVIRSVALLGMQNLFADNLLAFLLAVIKERTDPRTLPGTEAMMPGSALQRLLNHPAMHSQSDLAVIAGDIENASGFAWLAMMLSDRFFASRHDLVVNTGSMYGGMRRPAGTARALFDAGREVNHFNYFKNPRTVRGLLAALQRDDVLWQQFTPIMEEQREAPVRGVAPAALDGKRPVLLLIPGLMASHLQSRNNRVWLDMVQLAGGGMGDLRMDAPDVKAGEALATYYGDFINFMQNSHEVLVWPYDWRLAQAENARLLHEYLKPLAPQLKQSGQALRIFAHSLGGMVVRQLSALYSPLWNELNDLPGFRLIMLGTPNLGSYQSVRMIVGQHQLPGWLGLLDLSHDTEEIQRIINQYASSTDLLPMRDNQYDFTDPATWEQLRRESGGNWPLPEPECLARARKTREALARARLNPANTIYLAGQDSHTPYAMALEKSDSLFGGNTQEIVFYSTARGDGTVPWDLGMLPGIPAYYVPDVGHDQLLNCAQFFPAYLELAREGKTRVLLSEEPQTRSAEHTGPREKIAPDHMHYQATLDNFGGSSGRVKRRQAANLKTQKISVNVRHGDLAYALYPVVVGHYQGDTIVSAESSLDQKLDGALRERLRMGVYPGRCNTWHAFIAPAPQMRPGGALVVGLGKVGELSVGTLEAGLSSALVDFALQAANLQARQLLPKEEQLFEVQQGVTQTALSFLLIGTGAGGISVQDSVSVILRSVKKANQRLAAGRPQKSRIAKIEIVELFHDVALSAADALHSVMLDPELRAEFQWNEAQVIDSGSGYYRARYEEAQSWWQRTEISFDAKRQELRYVALTKRARAEQSLIAGQMQLARQFVREATHGSARNQEISRTLFEMLIPNRLKEFAPDRQDLVLVLDEESAWFPWEMMEDRWNGAEAEPPAVAAGLIRQLKTVDFRSQVSDGASRRALVVGNPANCRLNGKALTDLPGARNEAQRVASLFNKRRGIDVEHKIDCNAQDIMIALHADAYRILHLAGHGVHEFAISHSAQGDCESCLQPLPAQNSTLSGMVIGDGILLTAADIEQMRHVPDLVFINCCHLGQTTGRKLEHNGLAANLAAQFIRMGVRAVVAAGWEVDDSAACAFAERFYDAMLDGEPFGQAVKLARKHIHTNFPQVNTWGAYQCYGDPDFRLRADDNLSRRQHVPDFLSPQEMKLELDNLGQRARFGHAQARHVDAVLKRIPPGLEENWLKRADIATALGLAWGELQNFAKALDMLEQALAADSATLPVSALEQRANFKARLALQQFNQACANNADNLEDVRLQSLEKLATAEAELTRLLDFGPTMERYVMLASTAKRRALVCAAASEREALLQTMRSYYAKAQVEGQARKLSSQHPTLCLLMLDVLMAPELPLPQSEVRRIAASCDEIYNREKESNRSAPDFWAASALPQSLLIKSLANGQLPKHCEQIIKALQLARQPGASRREMASLQDNLQFLKEIWDWRNDQLQRNDEALRAEQNALEKICECVAAMLDA